MVDVSSYTYEQNERDFLQPRSEIDAHIFGQNYLNENDISLSNRDGYIAIDRANAARNMRGRVLVVDQWGQLSGPLSCWLDAFNLDFQSIVVANVQGAGASEEAPVAAAAIFCIPSSMNDKGWLDSQIALLRASAADLPIIVIGDGSDPVEVDEMVANFQLRSYLPTTSSTALASAALHVVAAGGCYYPPLPVSTPTHLSPSAEVKSELEPRPASQPYLTPKEKTVFELLASGLPNKIISYRLDLSFSPLKIHVLHIHMKL